MKLMLSPGDLELIVPENDLPALKAAASQLAAKIAAPLLVLVTGPMGAGKTTLVSAILQQWGIDNANSPTFNLRHDFSCEKFRIVHIDFYRLKPGDSGLDLLPPDEDYSDAVVFVEWPERVNAALYAPMPERVQLVLQVAPDHSRKISWQKL